MAEQKRLFSLDAYALIFRGYYAFIKNPRINSKGMDTSAIMGFTNSLLDVIRREKPDHLAVAFDKGGSVARTTRAHKKYQHRSKPITHLHRSGSSQIISDISERVMNGSPIKGPVKRKTLLPREKVPLFRLALAINTSSAPFSPCFAPVTSLLVVVVT